MKKQMMMIAIAALVAGSAFAAEGEGGSQQQKGRSWDRDSGGKPAWGQNEERGGQDRRGQMDKRGGDERGGGMMDPATMEQMRANHKAIRTLGEAARAETDEAKKAEIVAQIRVKLGEVADLMQTNQDKRLAQAEERFASLKAKIEASKAQRDSRIEEQVQRILSGERPERPDRFKEFPQAKGGRGERGGHGGGMAPPPGEDMPENTPPPSAE